MPYEPPDTALNLHALSLSDQALRLDQPPSSRCLVASDRLRVVLLKLPEGVRPAHIHPYADEVIEVVSGVVGATFADRAEQIVQPGDLLLAMRGVRHQIRVVGPEPAVLLCIVAPNVDTPDEQVNA